MPQITGSLSVQGAMVEVVVGLARSDVQRLRQALQPIPQARKLRALIDTGAQVTYLDPSVVGALTLPWSTLGLANMPAAVGMIPTTFHRASVVIEHSSGNKRRHLVAGELLVCELPLGLLGYEAVVGRDILDTLRFLYDGPARTFSLDY